MELIRRLLQKIEALMRRPRLERDLDDEIGFHLAMYEQRLREAGMSESDAREAAHRKFSNVVLVKEEARELWLFSWLDTLWLDVRYAFRSLHKSPLLALIIIITLALGIGANTAIFSVIDARFLQPLEFSKPDELVDINATSRQRGLQQAGMTLPEYSEWKQQSTTIQDMAFYSFEAFTFSESQGATRVNGWRVSPNFFSVLAEKPVRGRFFSPDEAEPGKDDVVVISESFWRGRLASDPNIIGRKLRVDSRPMTVIGIEPARSTFPIFGFDMYKPLPLSAEARADRNARIYGVIGRLQSGVSLAQAQAELAKISADTEHAFPTTDAGWTADIDTLLQRTVGGNRRSVYVLMAAVAFLLLIACLNIASLLTARMTTRAREIGLRTALGADKRRLLRQFLTEGTVLSLLGGVGGVLVSFPILRLLIARLPGTVARINGVGLDIPVLLFALLVCIGVGIVFGVLPAWGTDRAQLAGVLKDASATTTVGRTRMKLQNSLVVAQIAISLVLASGAGLLIRSFVALRNTDPGFKAEGVLINTLLVLPQDKYTTNQQCVAFFRQLLERIRALPGVKTAGGITAMPLSGNSSFRGYEIVGKPVSSPGGERAAIRNVVTEGYFETMGIPIRSGRFFRDSDNESAPRVAVINEALARQQFKNEDPIGQRIILHGSDSQPYEIVGVVGSSRQFSMSQDPSPEIFTPYRQSRLQFMYVLVKTDGNPGSLAGPIRSAVHDIDPDQPMGTLTLEQRFEHSIAGSRFYALLITTFAALALILAAVGVYGVLSYLVAQHTREIGIRMALGANRVNVWNQFVGRGLLLAGIGVITGVAASLGLTRAVAALLYHVGAADPLTLAGACFVLLLVTLIAAAVPAYRASRIDPMVALRYE
jgi:putative ABC transport system permease protein